MPAETNHVDKTGDPRAGSARRTIVSGFMQPAQSQQRDHAQHRKAHKCRTPPNKPRDGAAQSRGQTLPRIRDPHEQRYRARSVLSGNRVSRQHLQHGDDPRGKAAGNDARHDQHLQR